MTKFNFEKQLSRLEEIVAKLEEEQTDLDASVKLFEEGVTLSKELSQKLETVKFKVEELKKKGAEMMSEQELVEKFSDLKEYEHRLNNLEEGTILFTNPKQGLFIKAKQGILQILEIQAENAKRMSTSTLFFFS